MDNLKPGDVVAIKKLGRWWGLVTNTPEPGFPKYGVVIALIGRPSEHWMVYRDMEYRRNEIELVGSVNF